MQHWLCRHNTSRLRHSRGALDTHFDDALCSFFRFHVHDDDHSIDRYPAVDFRPAFEEEGCLDGIAEDGIGCIAGMTNRRKRRIHSLADNVR
jgi:hypothetical protein